MKYKNITQKDLFIPEMGLIRPDEVREMPKGFHNANFQEVKEENEKIKNSKNQNPCQTI